MSQPNPADELNTAINFVIANYKESGKLHELEKEKDEYNRTHCTNLTLKQYVSEFITDHL